MRYRDDPIYCTLAEAVADIAHFATGGSSALALDDLVSAAADGALEAVGSVANEIAPGKWRRKFAIEPVPAWVWRCIQRGQAGVSVDKCEITVRTYDEKAEAPRRLCFYDIRFEWVDIARVWPEPEPAPQVDAPIVQSPEASAANDAEAVRPKRRGAYRSELRKYMADRKLATLIFQGKQAVADEFVEHCQEKKPELLPILPKPREIANQVEKILGERRAQPVADAANDRTEPRANSAKRR